MRFGEALETAVEHLLAIDGGNVFADGSPRGIGGGTDEMCARLNKPFERILIVGLVALGEIGRGAVKVGDAVALRVPVGNSGIPKRRILENQFGTIGDVAFGVFVFATG